MAFPKENSLATGAADQTSHNVRTIETEDAGGNKIASMMGTFTDDAGDVMYPMTEKTGQALLAELRLIRTGIAMLVNAETGDALEDEL